MARIRQIKPEFYLDEELAGCSRDARYLFVGLWVMADKRGRLEDRPARIRAQVFPYDEDVTSETVDKLLCELTSGDFILRYEADGRKLIQVRSFEKHQHCHVKEQESTIPAPKNDKSTVHAPDKHRTSTVHAPDLHHTCTHTSTSGYMEDGEWGVGAGTVQAPDKPGASTVLSHSSTDESKQNQKPKQDPQQDSARQKNGNGIAREFRPSRELREWAARHAGTVDLQTETEKFIQHYLANGEPRADWDAAWRKWMLGAVEYARNRPKNGKAPPASDARWDEVKRNLESGTGGGSDGSRTVAAKPV